ncbi:MAG: alpha/beta hydrolase [Gammaproteobacteria bacterium AqS3]|nr:alpha/beta hydrolase [Gammaproteobacteria bacterium AqS3]
MRWLIGFVVLSAVLFLGWMLPLVLIDSLPLDARERAGLPGRFAQLSQGQTYYRIRGNSEGVPLVLVHGFSTPGNLVWGPLLGQLDLEQYHVLEMDLFGRGFSDRPELDYQARVFQLQLSDLLSETGFDAAPFVLVGYSMGGPIVTQYAADNPDQIRRLITIAPAGYPLPSTRTGELVRLPVVGLWLFHLLGPENLEAGIALDVEQGTVDFGLLHQFRRQTLYSDTLDALHSTLMHYPLNNQRQHFRQVGAQSYPVGVIWGLLDEFTPYHNSAKLMEDIPRAELCTIEGNHGIIMNKPVEMAQCLESLLNDAPPPDDAGAWVY